MKKILIALSLCSVLCACNSFLDMTPRDSISDKVMWATTESAEYAVNSIYSYAYDIFAVWPSAVGMTEAFTDEFKYGSYVNFAFCLIPSQVAYGGTNLTTSFVSVYLGCWSSLGHFQPQDAGHRPAGGGTDAPERRAAPDAGLALLRAGKALQRCHHLR